MRQLILLTALLLGCIEFDTSYDLEAYDLDLEFDVATLEVDAGTAIRYVETGEHGLSMHLEAGGPSYEGITLEYNGNGILGYCGPAALTNLLRWYGIHLPLSEAAELTRVHERKLGVEAWAACAAVCGGDLAVCTNICYDLTDKLETVGTSFEDGARAVRLSTPPGYVYRHTREDPSAIVELIEQLREGNPVIINEWLESGDGNPALHMSVLTGLEIGDDGEVWVRMVNSVKRPLGDFMRAWSLKGLGSERRRRYAKRFFGIKPFTAAWYEREED